MSGAKEIASGEKLIADNRKAFYNYAFEEKFEAGIALKGTEVKSCRDGKCNLNDAYALFRGHELFIVNAHIGTYSTGSYSNHEPLRSRKLLMHGHELKKLWGKLETRGFSLIPLQMYFKHGRVKVQLGLGRGKKTHDKRQSTKERDAKREMAKVKKNAGRED